MSEHLTSSYVPNGDRLNEWERWRGGLDTELKSINAAVSELRGMLLARHEDMKEVWKEMGQLRSFQDQLRGRQAVWAIVAALGGSLSTSALVWLLGRTVGG